MSKNKYDKVLSNAEGEIVNSVIKHFGGIKMAETCQQYEQIDERVPMASDLPECAIIKNNKDGPILEKPSSEERNTNTKECRRRPMPNHDELCALREIIEVFYENMEIPTVHKIITTARNQLDFEGSRARMRSILRNKLGFKFNKHYPDNNIIFERNSILIKRVKYLRPIRENKDLGENKKPVVYVGEMVINIPTAKSSEDSTKNTRHHAEKWIIYHACTENGFLGGAELYYNLSSNKTSDFLQYVEKHLIPKLPKDCIVVMNYSTQHNKEVDAIPTMLSTTVDIKNWMLAHNIPFEKDLLKIELLMLIKRTRPVKKYAVDELLTRHGHEVHRIPPFHTELNPLEYIWMKIKSNIGIERQDGDGAICNLVQQAIGSITAKDWKKTIDRVKKFEDRYWLRDIVKEDDYEDLYDSNGMLLSDSDSDSDTEYGYDYSSSSSSEDSDGEGSTSDWTDTE